MRILVSVPVLVAALAFLVSLLPSDAPLAEAASFNPHGSTCLDDATTPDIDLFTPGNPGECDGDSSPGAPASLSTTFEIDAPDSNFNTAILFTPSEWTVARDDDVPNGARVARLVNVATLGFLNGPCNSLIQVPFNMLDATTDRSLTVTYFDQFLTQGGLPLGVTRYPDNLTRALLDGAGNPLQLRARYYGQTALGGVLVNLNLVTFEPGTNLLGRYLDPRLGYASLFVLLNQGDPSVEPAPGLITDFCTPLKTAITIFDRAQDNPQTPGDEGGATIRRNPAADGGYNFVTYANSELDADGDGYENSLDTCPLIPNPGWDPRSQDYVGDRDKDGLPDNCDPLPDDRTNPGVGSYYDHDGDGYENRQDNCPLAKNSLGIGYIGEGGPDNQGDRDGDGIGNACDPNPTIPDGAAKAVCIVNTINVGAGGAPKSDPRALFPCTSQADVKIASTTIVCPQAITPGALFACTVGATLHNNGPRSSASVGGAMNVGFPAGCSVQDYTPSGKGFGSLSLPASASVAVTKDFNLACSGDGPQEFAACAILQLREAGVSDPDPSNNVGVGYTTAGEGDGPAAPSGRCSTLDPPEVCGDGIDNDNDGLIDEEPDTDGDGISDCVDTDDDGDGFSDEIEAFLGTDPLAACPAIVGAHPSWPPDFNDDRVVNLGDVMALKPVFGSANGDGRYVSRQDLDASGSIDIGDVLALKPFFGASCT